MCEYVGWWKSEWSKVTELVWKEEEVFLICR